MLRRPPSSAWTERRTNNGNDGRHGVQGAAYDESSWSILYLCVSTVERYGATGVSSVTCHSGLVSKASMYLLVVVPTSGWSMYTVFLVHGFIPSRRGFDLLQWPMFRCRFSREGPRDAASAAVSENPRAKLHPVIARALLEHQVRVDFAMEIRESSPVAPQKNIFPCAFYGLSHPFSAFSSPCWYICICTPRSPASSLQSQQSNLNHLNDVDCHHFRRSKHIGKHQGPTEGLVERSLCLSDLPCLVQRQQWRWRRRHPRHPPETRLSRIITG